MREASAIMAKAGKAVKGAAKLAELVKIEKAAIKVLEKATKAFNKANDARVKQEAKLNPAPADANPVETPASEPAPL